MAPSAVSDSNGISLATDTGKTNSQEPTPLEAISQGEVLPGIPVFPDYVSERKHILTHMAATFRQWSRLAFTEGQSGHISVRDPEYPNLMWINPLSVHFGMITAGRMLGLRISDGAIVAGVPNPSTGRRTANRAGYFIHSAIHKARPDAHAICHAHTHAGRAWAAFGKPLQMLTQDVCNFYGCQTVYDTYGGIVFGEDEGERIASALGPSHRAAILMSHGLLTIGKTVDEAGFMFGLLDRSCAIQLAVEAAENGKLQRVIISDEEAAYNCRMASEPNALYREAQPDLEMEFEAAGGEEVLARGFEELVIDTSML